MMKRISFYLPEHQIEGLDRAVRRILRRGRWTERPSRTQLVRRAIDQYLTAREHRSTGGEDGSH